MKAFDAVDAGLPGRLRYMICLFVLSRLALTAVGVAARDLAGLFGGKLRLYSEYVFLDIWGVWDTHWYLDIAENWYSALPSTHPITYDQANYAFFPLYPGLIKIANYLVGDLFISGLIISNLCLFAASIYLYKLVRLDHDESMASRSVKFMYLFPSAFIFSSVLTESLFLLLLLACFYHARRNEWVKAGLLGFLLSSTKSIGFLLVLPLVIEQLKSKTKTSNLFFLSLFLLGPALFSIYTYTMVGDLFAYTSIQERAWGCEKSNPLALIYDSLLSNNMAYVSNAIFTFLSLFLLNFYFKRIRLSYLIAGNLIVFSVLSFCGLTVISSMFRHILPVFPLYIILAGLGDRGGYDNLLTYLLATSQLFLMAFWSVGTPVVI